MVYSDKYKFIYYAVPKTASRSIQDHLKNYGVRSRAGWNPNHDNYDQVKEKLGDEKSNNYLKFSFFRNPWSMLISHYFFNRSQLNLPPHKKAVIEWLNTYRGGDPYIPYIFDKDGDVILDFIGKMENINEYLKIICKKLNIPIPKEISHIGRQNIKGRVHYKEYYEDPALRQKIKNIFSKSLSVLKYEFDDAGR